MVESHKVDASQIGKRIRELRTKLDLTQEAVARLVGVTHVTENRWENAKNVPSLEHLAQLAEVLGTSVIYLISGADISDEREMSHPYGGWVEFIATDEGRSMTPGERAILSEVRWEEGYPDKSHYSELLRMTRKFKLDLRAYTRIARLISPD